MLFSGRKRPRTVNIDLLRHWLRLCHSGHENLCAQLEHDNPQARRIRRIRFIDLKDLCVRTLEDFDHTQRGHEYVALSYVWGSPKQATLTSENIYILGQTGELTKQCLPQTISDAIQLVQLLGFRFLWVDALCIIQNDDGDKSEQIGNMSQVYGLAFLTIIAACGTNSMSGLAGLRPGTRSFEQREVVVIPPGTGSAGLSLLTTCESHQTGFWSPSGSDFELSAWNSRGWTLQELAMSRRCLIFTRHQALWSCGGGFFCEESRFEHPLLDPDVKNTAPFSMPIRFALYSVGNVLTTQRINGTMSRFITSSEQFWDKYNRLVQNFTFRQFSFNGDRYDGFRGIEDALHQISGEEFYWGHPRSRFEFSLSWVPEYGLHRNDDKTTLPITSLNQRVSFPSWSWMGWIGRVSCSVRSVRSVRLAR
ncbi:heterokaryon incompatibility protein-domain-containing protein [Xylaria bambusicola]|uniref:heterokaryon incompatibility protein-domain-containing protein n=1 Tax=Xylaria bambusicola TaxID=326684 RepID=UPI0020088987|nr:heterokaryon incompatibility protein-domain-containing protein [Xylaria bambusicola]KAI0514666.1 heterokaryon incompatibility protein-domain-containing protein [Xylaria bambusicola]